MKKVLMLLCILFCTGSVTELLAQTDRQSRKLHMEQVQSLKIAYMTDALKLTPQESEKFWPLYNQFWHERGKLSHEKRRLFRKIESAVATQNDMAEVVKIMKQEATLIENSFEQYSKVLPMDKAVKVVVVEENFKNVLFKKAAGPGGPGGGGEQK